MRRWIRVAACAAAATVAAGIAAAPAWATFPGGNGRILGAIYAGCDPHNPICAPNYLRSYNLNGSGLLNYPATNTSPDVVGPYGAVSPDGKRIAFTGGSDGGVHVMNVDGSGDRTLVPNPLGSNGFYSYSSISWLPDGCHVVYADSTGQLFEADVLTGVPVPILPGKKVDNPLVSPDGRLIAYLAHGSFSLLRVMNFDGSGDHPLWSGGSAAFPDSWAPSGRTLAFYWATSSQSGIATVQADGTHYTALGDGSTAVWSPDGTKLLVDFGGGPQGLDARLMNPDGSDQVAQPQLDSLWPFVDWQSLH